MRFAADVVEPMEISLYLLALCKRCQNCIQHLPRKINAHLHCGVVCFTLNRNCLFDYFPTKEEVIFFWQDSFGEALAAAVAARPANEPLAQTVEEAFISSIEAATHPETVAIDKLIRRTASLRERNYLKYAKLEETLADALVRRSKGDRERFRAKLLAAIVIGGLRLGDEQWQKNGNTDLSKVRAFTKKMFHQIWKELSKLGDMAVKSAPPRGDAIRSGSRAARMA